MLMMEIQASRLALAGPIQPLVGCGPLHTTQIRWASSTDDAASIIVFLETSSRSVLDPETSVVCVGGGLNYLFLSSSGSFIVSRLWDS